MTIEPLDKENSRSFRIKHEGNQYKATIWLDSDSHKFIDWEVLDESGEQIDTEIETEIIQHIDENWDIL